jgi:hypothetical protein
MRKISILDRILLMAAAILAAYQVVNGIEGLGSLSIISYTVGFGFFLVAGLLLIILGFEILESPHVIVVSTIIPLSFSLGLVAEFFPQFKDIYLIFTTLGFLAILVTRYAASQIIAVGTLAVFHGIAGLVIFLLPILLSALKRTPVGFALVGVGGALISLFGLLFSFLRAGKPLLSLESIVTILPGLHLAVTATFVIGFATI